MMLLTSFETIVTPWFFHLHIGNDWANAFWQRYFSWINGVFSGGREP